jgi:uncharacterized membrane protein
MRHTITWTFLSLWITSTCTADYITPPGMEKCFGIADAHQNDGPFSSDDPETSQGAGGSKIPCEGAAWRWVPKGKCTTIMIGFKKDGAALTGTLEPRPLNVNPEKCLPYKEFGQMPTASQDNAQSGNTAAAA